ncbi:MAG: hypothetical protein JXM69_01310 [Anaerolineae bacterium]|nr:hypothetical protein [Anaerolineae bacterium]
MTTKLKIDLNQGLLEVEGSESFVKLIYNDFKTHFAGIDTVEDLKPARRTRRSKPAASTTPSQPAPESAPVPEPATAEVEVMPIPEKPHPPAPTYTLVSDLQLGASDGRPSLVEFMDAKFPLTNEERNIVFLYYLQHTLKLKPITPDHIYTCYKQAKIRVPLNLENSLRITADQHGWIKTTNTGAMTLTPSGKRYVEKQLPKKVKH